MQHSAYVAQTVEAPLWAQRDLIPVTLLRRHVSIAEYYCRRTSVQVWPRLARRDLDLWNANKGCTGTHASIPKVHDPTFNVAHMCTVSVLPMGRLHHRASLCTCIKVGLCLLPLSTFTAPVDFPGTFLATSPPTWPDLHYMTGTPRRFRLRDFVVRCPGVEYTTCMRYVGSQRLLITRNPPSPRPPDTEVLGPASHLIVVRG